jgi:F-type H+-transporting ATPase subunit epsilon
MVVVPGSEGDFGVLIGHAPLISTLRDGVIEVHDEGRVSDRIFVAGGFAEVTGERCTVRAEEAVPVGELDRGAIEDELKSLREDLAAATEDPRRIAFARRIEVAEAKIAAL